LVGQDGSLYQLTRKRTRPNWRRPSARSATAILTSARSIGSQGIRRRDAFPLPAEVILNRDREIARKSGAVSELRLLANGLEPRSGRPGDEWNREPLRRIDLRWHDLRPEGACRLLADGVGVRIRIR